MLQCSKRKEAGGSALRSLLLKNRLAGGCEFPVDNFIEKFLVFGRVLITLADVKWRSSIPEDFSAAQDAHSPG
jgi:hypothetical protein